MWRRSFTGRQPGGENLEDKYKRTIKFFSYVSIGLGYILMTIMVYLVGRIVYIYIAFPSVVKAIKIPPILPLVPYFTELPGIKGIFPTFYFIDFIFAIMIVATVHELSHGIFMRRWGIKIKSTGIAFLKWFPVFLGAFVEQDEKSMVNKKKFEQMSVLGAGVLANVLTAILFFVVLGIFFSLAFSPGGVIFDDYSYSIIEISSITMVNGIVIANPSYESIEKLMEDAEFNDIKANGRNFVGVRGVSQDRIEIALYDDAPAINSKLNGVIVSINNVKINSVDELSAELAKYDPGEKIEVKTTTEDETQTYDIILEENPHRPGSSWLGVGFFNRQIGGVMNKIFNPIESFVKKQNVYYFSKIGDFGVFIYDLFWWIALINLLVALFNMLPFGGLDGGRFFYLTILAITKSEKIAITSFKYLTKIFLFLLFLIMIFWAFAVFF